MVDIYIVGDCPCGGRIIVPVLKSRHFRPQPPVCEASGMEMCARLPPGERQKPEEPPRHFIMESR